MYRRDEFRVVSVCEYQVQGVLEGGPLSWLNIIMGANEKEINIAGLEHYMRKSIDAERKDQRELQENGPVDVKLYYQRELLDWT